MDIQFVLENFYSSWCKKKCFLFIQNVMQSMELRKSHVGKLTGIANQLLDIIGMDGPVSYNVLSEVADIHASWNNVLKQSIENGTKVI